MKTYPEGTTFGPWIVTEGDGHPAVRRWISLPNERKVFERLPVDRYGHLRNAPQDLKAFVIRLNGFDPEERRIRKHVEFKHAFISPDLLEDYRSNYLKVQIANVTDAKTMYMYLTKYALDFFINRLRIPDPLQWHFQQHLWGRYLLNKDPDLKDDLRIFAPGELKAAKVLRYVVHELNRFMKYLHLKRPTEVTLLHFDPLSHAALKDHEARRKMEEDVFEAKYINGEHWKLIQSKLSEKNMEWASPVCLAHAYGLRRSESLALRPEDVRRSHISLERQVKKETKNGERLLGPLKNRLNRKVPHWFMQPASAYSLISRIPKMHPDTLTEYFSDFTRSLGIGPYVLHDLRRTFITNAIRKGILPEDLRLAVGHANIQTTYRFYVMDARELEDTPWTPENSNELQNSR